MAEKERVYGERYPIDEDFLAALGAHAAGQRRRARLRPAGDAGDRRAAHRAGALDAGGRSRSRQQIAMTSPARPSPTWSRPASSPPRSSPTSARVAARYAVAITPGDGRADRPRRSARSDRAAVRARRRRADTAPGGARRPDRRRRALAGRQAIVHRYPDRVLLKLVHVCAVYCRFCFRREMVGPGGEQVLSARALDAALAYIARAARDLGSDPDRRRSAGAVAAPPRRGRSRRLAAIEHVKVVRLHTRVPVVEPERVTADAGRARSSADGKAVYVGAARQPSARADAGGARRLRAPRRCRHPDASASRCCCAGVNDDAQTLGALMRAFVEMPRSSPTICTTPISRPAPRTSAPRSRKARR